VASEAGKWIERMATYETTYEAQLMNIAHLMPRAKSSGAAMGGPRMTAVAAVAWPSPKALARSASPWTISPIVAKRAGLKNWPAELTTRTTA
jgi:hypothetical protein